MYLKNLPPMILCNLALEIEHLLPAGYLEQTMETCIHEVMDVFCRPSWVASSLRMWMWTVIWLTASKAVR